MKVGVWAINRLLRRHRPIIYTAFSSTQNCGRKLPRMRKFCEFFLALFTFLRNIIGSETRPWMFTKKFLVDFYLLDLWILASDWLGLFTNSAKYLNYTGNNIVSSLIANKCCCKFILWKFMNNINNWYNTDYYHCKFCSYV